MGSKRIRGKVAQAGSTIVIKDGAADQTTLAHGGQAGTITVTLPAATDTLVGKATTDTLTNKTLTSPDINTPDIDGGTIDDTVIGGTTPAAGSFTTLTASSTVTLGGSVAVTRTSTDTGADRLQNKDLSDDSVKFVDNADTTKALDVSLGGATTSTKTTLAASQTANRTVTLPDATDTLVGKATTDTLTNKTLVAANNTITTAASGNLTATELNAALAELQGDIDTRLTSSAITNMVEGPASSTDNRIARYDGNSGKLLQNSGVAIDDSNNITGVTSVTVGGGVYVDGSSVQATSGNLTLGASGDVVLDAAADSVVVDNASTLQLKGTGGVPTGLTFYDGDETNTIQVTIPTVVGTNRTPQIPDDTGNFVLTTATQTLTNKTVDGNSNILTVLAASQLSGATPIANGGTGQTSATAAFDALAPTTTAGDVIYHNGTDNVRLGIGSAGQVLKTNAGATAPEWGDAGGGSGEKNYIENPSAASAITGWTNVGDLDVARTTTAGDLPREYTTGSGIKITADTNTQSTADYVYYDFTLDDVDLNKKLKIQWAQKQTGSYVAGDLAVIITTQADRTTAVATPDVTAIPAYDGVFQASFDTSSTATLSLVIRATTDMATDAGIVISDVIVGPGNIVAVPAVGNWETVTVDGSWIANSTYTAKMKRNTDTADFDIHIALAGAPTSASLTVNMPTGMTIDTTALSVSGALNPFGKVTIRDSGTATYQGRVMYSGTSAVAVYYGDDAAAAVSLTAVTQAAPITFASGDFVNLRFSVPIAEWAGAPNYAGQNNVEYVFNSSTTTSNDTTSFAYGSQGIAVASFAPAGTTAVAKDVQFLTPLQSDEVFSLQFNDGFGWTDVGNTELGFSSNAAGTTFYGAKATATSATKVRVSFYSKAKHTAWSSYTSYKWRVVKAKAGAAVGFGLADTSGRAGLVNPYTEGSGVVYSGTYTPTVSNLTNGSAATVRQHNYMRVGKIVFVSGRVDFTLTTTLTDTSFDLTLPVSTANFSDGYQATGSGMLHRSASAVSNPALVYSVNSSQTVQVFIEYATAPSATSVQAYYSFSYEIQ